MSRLFLSGQTTCALLLGAGLLLRAQAALRFEPEPAQAQAQAPQQAAKSAFEHDAAPAARGAGPDGHASGRSARPLGTSHALRADLERGIARGRAEHAVTHPRKARAQGWRLARERRCGAPLADGSGQGLAPQGKRCR